MIIVAQAIALGLTAGFLSSLLGIGGGLLMVPIFVGVMKMEMHQAVGTSLLIIVPTAFTGVFRYWTAGQVNWKVGLLVAGFACLAAFVGAHFSLSLPAATLKKVFAGFLLVIAIYMLWKG